jgi:hypothetical protein
MNEWKNEYLVGGNHDDDDDDDDDKSFSVFELLSFSRSGLCFKCLMSTPFYNYQPNPLFTKMTFSTLEK